MANPFQSLRKELRQQRRALTPQQQVIAAKNLYKQVIHNRLFRNAKHIAFYIANDGEIDPYLLLTAAQRYKKKIYLPVIHHWPKNTMSFQIITTDTRWIFNKYKIKEPKSDKTKQVTAKQLDLIFMPLVGFDEQGNRLGMGAGYYDRHLAYLKFRNHWQTPKLIGLAHECQKVTKLSVNSWDIPLFATVTDKAWYLATY